MYRDSLDSKLQNAYRVYSMHDRVVLILSWLETTSRDVVVSPESGQRYLRHEGTDPRRANCRRKKVESIVCRGSL